MYHCDQYDRTLVDERVAQYRDQIRRRLSGELSAEEFRPLRSQNGRYMHRHAYMNRIAILSGMLKLRPRVGGSQASLWLAGPAAISRAESRALS